MSRYVAAFRTGKNATIVATIKTQRVRMTISPARRDSKAKKANDQRVFRIS
jgi:hypothetical protein